MKAPLPRWPAAVALASSLVGLAFAGISTRDFAAHLDRRMHEVSCSFIPGLAADAGENACAVAMFSPYSAILRDRFWGGVPISLFAVGAFAFFAAFALYLLVAGARAPRRAGLFLLLAGLTPALVSLVMFAISALRLGTFCKVCVGIYAASAGLAVASIAHFVAERRDAAAEARRAGGERPYDPALAAAPVPPTLSMDPPRRAGGPLLLPVWFALLGVCAALPALAYVSALPSYAKYLTACGTLPSPKDKHNALIRFTPPRAVRPAVMVLDPLCPTCKGFHQRIEAEGILERLDSSIVLFPLDNECNWMVDRALHPGACLVSKAVLCAGPRAMQVLEWAFEEQETILSVARDKAGANNVRAMLRARWADLDVCVDAKETKKRLDHMLHYAIDNRLPVSTPQLFLGEQRICDEDTDLGLRYTFARLAPEVLR